MFNFPKRLVEELRRENAFLKAQLRSLSICSRCSGPLARDDGPPKTVFNHSTPESDTASSEVTEPPDAHEQDFDGDELAARFSQFSLESMKTSYFGSAFAPDLTATPLKDEDDGRPLRSRRRIYWEMSPWEKEAYAIETPRYVFPPTPPILHRPSFERSVAEGLHTKDVAFAGTLLCVLGLASRYSNDPRVLSDGDPLSAGWKFIKQVRILRRLFDPTIYEVQIYCLMSYYALGGSVPQVAWVYIGLGIRFLQQRGEYRRKPKGHRSGSEDELWKRAFWSFAVLERMVCLILGHPMCLHVENYNVDLPLEVDDEYWDQDFVQPPGKPSRLTYFIWHLRLCEIIGDTTRKLYGSKKSKLLLGWDGPGWEQRTVLELDKAMNEFMDSIPSHIRWDPKNLSQGIFFDQAATLQLTYNYARIAIHRPFIHKATPELAKASLSICTTAARRALRIADTWLSKFQRTPLYSLINPVFISGIILVLNTIATKRAGLPIDTIKEDLVLIETAMEILKFAEYRLKTVGRLRDLLGELRTLDGPFPQSPSPRHTEVGTNGAGSNVQDSFYSQLPPSAAYADPVSSVGSSENAFYSQLPVTAGYANAVLSSGHAQSGSSLHTDPKLFTFDGVLDDELLSVWMTAPSDVSNLHHWDTYLQNRNVNTAVDPSWTGDSYRIPSNDR
ncbi:Zn(2)-C6 fungal-type domain-containing protein [Mycena sanguinolenta]|uniref:Zn(2)-C6 fungal-type domain-containing protein n=1 Tax=Mycena sanguinolenta TaxID=230812 RepID=A0A8H7CQ78_9AGAR|nr:Zn(2)-C6 fungal-type domain-containing protein [Mycena sanguinolenta]